MGVGVGGPGFLRAGGGGGAANLKTAPHKECYLVLERRGGLPQATVCLSHRNTLGCDPGDTQTLRDNVDGGAPGGKERGVPAGEPRVSTTLLGFRGWPAQGSHLGASVCLMLLSCALQQSLGCGCLVQLFFKTTWLTGSSKPSTPRGQRARGGILVP